MGKRSQDAQCGIPAENNSSNCMWGGVLSILKYQSWRNIKKRLPRKKHDDRRVVSENNTETAEEAKEFRPNNGDGVGDDNSQGKEKSRKPMKSSVKARLKALITEDKSKRKGGHLRMETYPIQSKQTKDDSKHHFEPLNQDFSEVVPKDNEQQHKSSSIVSQHPPLSNSPDESTTNDQICEGASIEKSSSKKGDENEHSFSEHHKFPQKDQTVKNVSEIQSTEDICKQSMPLIAAEYRADGISQLNQVMAETAESSMDSCHSMKKHGDNQVVVKRFKDLKEKLKHAVKEGKIEIHRISMDGVLDKIPHKHGFSKDLGKEIIDKFKNLSMNKKRISHEVNHHVSSSKKSGLLRRTSSLSESLDRYLHLYEFSCNRDVKHHRYYRTQLLTQDSELHCTNTSKSLVRILSLPELKSYFYYSSDVSPDVCSEMIPTRSTSLDGQRNVDSVTTSKNQSLLNSPKISDNREHWEDNCDAYSEDQPGSTITADCEENMKTNVVSDNSDNLVAGGNDSFNRPSTEDPIECSIEPENQSPLLLDGLSFKEEFAEFSVSEDLDVRSVHPNQIESSSEPTMDTPVMAVSGVNDCDINETQHLESKELNTCIDAKDSLKFDYVKYILEISGFSGGELLGTWHSDDQPLDPAMYEEVGGCMLLDPEFTGNEEGANSSQLLMFFLINEMLLEIYERSYSYFPGPLSPVCKIRPMPLGQHVLKEVWDGISWLLKLRPEENKSLDYAVTRDLARTDGWMNLQFDSECIALEVEDFIFNDLLEEVLLM